MPGLTLLVFDGIVGILPPDSGARLLVARKSKVEACIFCGNLPCTCGTAVKKQAAPRVSKTATATASSKPVDEPFDTSLRPRNRFKKHVEQAKEEAESQEILELHQAIRNLEPLLSTSEKRRWSNVLYPPLPPAVGKRLSEWRERAKG